jgi:hypothetical protein
MTERDFRRLMMIYGGDIGRWPPAKQAAAEKWQLAHPEFRSALVRMAELDRLLLDAAPQIDPARVDRAMDSVLRQTAGVMAPRRRLRPRLPRFTWPQQWYWAPRGAVYLGLFILGCAANVAVRLLSADTPFDLWLSGNLSLPLGG